MSKRTTRAQVARETLSILEQGVYRHSSGQRVSLREAMASAHSHSVLYSPDDFQKVFAERDRHLRDRPPIVDPENWTTS